MKHLPIKSLLTLSLLAALISFNACQKENLQIADKAVPNTSVPAGDRGPHIVYGVTVFSAGHPSQLVEMDLAGNVLANIGVFIDNGSGVNVPLDDLKGVCYVNGQLFLTTGPNNVDAYDNMLIKVNPATGQAGAISYSTVGTVSDIDYDEISGNIYGLRNNSNTMVTIGNAGNNWSNYALGAINNMATYVAKGLTMVRDGAGDRIVVAATIASGGNARLFSAPAGGGGAALLTVVLPAASLAAGHCGLGFDMDINSLLINRNTNAPGVNSFGWINPLLPQTASANWGGTGFNFEDLTSSLQ